MAPRSLPGLLAWYRHHRRSLPWRRSRDPYRVWVAEVMLQQTTVKTVLPYYERFLARFPDVHALAVAPETDVVAAWSGLGYYHRARNLHRASRHLVERHAGRFPRTLLAALAIPGVGLYTASAILSIAHDQPLAVVDGNVRRVLARVFALRGPEWRSDAPFYNLASDLLDPAAPGDWNQALMELGATICTPRRPACPACPLRAQCAARRSGQQEELPEARARRKPIDVTVAVALVQRQGQFLLVRRAEGRLLSAMWELPQTTLESHGLPDLATELRERHALEVAPGQLLATARHTITHRRIRVEVYAARLRRRPAEDPARFVWATPAGLRSLPVSSMTYKILRAVAGGQLPLQFA